MTFIIQWTTEETIIRISRAGKSIIVETEDISKPAKKPKKHENHNPNSLPPDFAIPARA
jgi:hypothetical protein